MRLDCVDAGESDPPRPAERHDICQEYYQYDFAFVGGWVSELEELPGLAAVALEEDVEGVEDDEENTQRKKAPNLN